MPIALPRPANLDTRPARGFTLIELLVVVAVMSSVALLAFGVATEDRAQLRYNDTRTRLNQLERAILGRLGPVDAASVGGFVADNGELPTSIAQLLAKDANRGAQAAQQPIFDPVPNKETCENNGDNGNDEKALADSSALLVKGHRGNYLGGAAFNGRFRDGWGNESSDATADAINFGWGVPTATDRSLTITSRGADNVSGGDDFAADVARTIAAGEWLVPIGGWSVGVANYSGVDIAAKKLSASLLVFHNDTTGGHWRRYSTAVSSVCLDGTGDGLVAGGPCPQSVTLSFPVGCFPAETAAVAIARGHDKIPQGRHLLVLVEDSDETPWNSTDTVYFASSPTTRPISAQITVVAGMALPAARLEIR